MYVCMYVCMYVGMYVCMYIYIEIYLLIYIAGYSQRRRQGQGMPKIFQAQALVLDLLEDDGREPPGLFWSST